MFSYHRACLLAALLLIGPALIAEQRSRPEDGPDDLAPEAQRYASLALRTARFTRERLAFLAGSDECGSAGYVSFKRNVGSPLSDAWYNASQLMADAAMLRISQFARACGLVKNIAFLDLLGRPNASGGYLPRANVDARELSSNDIYADDNALIGLALLDTRGATADPAWREGLLRRAQGAAHLLIGGGLWDDAFGGGFWWNSNRGQMPEGKPTQTTAMAALLFVRLFEATGDARYAGWARASLAWLDDRLLDHSLGLYRYGLRHWDMPGQGGEYVDPRLYSYDQGIMIEVHLAFDSVIEPDRGHQERARGLGERLLATFWDRERGGFHLDAREPDVYSAYSAWVTQSLVALNDADPNPLWLAYAKANLDAIETYLRDPADDGYFYMQYRCRRLEQPGCEQGNVWSLDPTKYLISQAWVQRGQALLAARLSGT